MSNAKESADEGDKPSAEDLFLSFDGSGSDRKKARTEATADELLLWRLDPEESYSDWTIVIKNETDEQGQKRTFNVHKSYLSLGPHKSKYFASLFGPNSGFKESKGSISELSLPSLACHAFEHMLDFMYGLHNDQSFGSTLSEDDLVALRYLSKRFMIQSLFDRVSELIKNRLERNFGLVCIPMMIAADALHDEQLISQNLDIEQVEMLDQLEPRLALKLFEDSRVIGTGVCWFAQAVVDYCKKNRDKIDRDFFRRATRGVREAFLPDALFLINLSREFDNGEDDELEDLRKRIRVGLHKTEFYSSNYWYFAAAHLTGETRIADTIVRNTRVELVSQADVMSNYNSMASEEKVKLLEQLLSFALHDKVQAQNTG